MNFIFYFSYVDFYYQSRRKSKGTAHVLDEPIDDTFDAMLDSASKVNKTHNTFVCEY